MPVSLPQEILHMTVDYFHDDLRMLKAFSLVSKSWLASARYHLFFCVHFRNYADLDCIGRWMSSPHLSQLVQQIFIGLGTLSATKFSSMSNYSLSTEFCDEPLRWQSLAQIIALFPRITSLNLDFVKFDAPPDAFRLVASFPCLRHLRWINVRFKRAAQDNVYSIPPPSCLRDLHIRCHGGREDAEHFLRWISSFSPQIHLKSLAIGWSVEVAHLTPIITSWGPSLATLDLSGLSSCFEIAPVVSMTCLRVMRFPFIHLRRSYYAEDKHQWVYRLLSSISSPHIRIIGLPLEVYYDLSDDDEDDSDEENVTDSLENLIFHQLDRLDWKRIDQAVVKMKGWSSLQRVVIWMKLVETDFPAASRVMYKLLPNAIANGVVVEARMWSADS